VARGPVDLDELIEILLVQRLVLQQLTEELERFGRIVRNCSRCSIDSRVRCKTSSVEPSVPREPRGAASSMWLRAPESRSAELACVAHVLCQR